MNLNCEDINELIRDCLILHRDKERLESEIANLNTIIKFQEQTIDILKGLLRDKGGKDEDNNI